MQNVPKDENEGYFRRAARITRELRNSEEYKHDQKLHGIRAVLFLSTTVPVIVVCWIYRIPAQYALIAMAIFYVLFIVLLFRNSIKKYY